MRVTEGIISRSIANGLAKLGSDLQNLNLQISSGKRLLAPSDDPAGAVAALAVRGKLAGLEQAKRNVDSWRGWLQATENAMSSAQSVASRARELAVQMSNATYEPAQRINAAQEINNLLEELVALGNTRHQDRYVFAGFRDDAKAFEVTRVNGDITAVTYAGDSGHHEIKLGPDSRMESSLTGQEAFMASSDLFQALIDLREALKNNDPDGAADVISDLENAGNNLSAKVADVGSRVNRCDMRLTIIQDTKLADTERLAEIEDVDLVAAIISLQTKEVVYEAALKTAATLQQLNLAAYI